MSQGDDNNNQTPDSDDDGHTAVMTLDQMKEAGLFDDDTPTEPPVSAGDEATTAPTPADDDDGEHTMMMDASLADSIAPEPPTASSPPSQSMPADDDDGEHTMMMDASVADSIAPQSPAAPPAPTQQPPADDDDGEHTMMMDASVADSIAQQPPAAAPAPPHPPQQAPADDDDDEHTMMMDASLANSVAQQPPATPAAPEQPPQPAPVDDDGEHTMMMDPSAASAASAAAPEKKEVTKLVPKMRVTEGADEGRTYELDSTSSLVGRGLDCDIILNDASVSRKHFRIDRNGSIYTLVNLSQGNGTKVNGVKVKDVQLRHGATIEAGTTLMRWEDVGGEDAASAKPASSVADQFTDFGAEPEGADATRMCDLADLENLPGWEQPGQPMAAPPQAKGGAGKGILIAFLILVFLGGGFVALDKFAGLGVIFDDDTSTSTKGTSSETAEATGDGEMESPDTEQAPPVCLDRCDPDDLPTDDEFGGPGNAYPDENACLIGCMRFQALELKKKANALMKEQKWEDARSTFKDAKVFSPSLADEMDRSIRRAESEMKVREQLKNALASLDAGNATAALKVLQSIPQSSSYFVEAGEHVFKAEDECVIQASDSSDKAIDDKKFDDAIATLQRTLKLVGKDSEAATELRALLKEAREAKDEENGQNVEVAANDAKPTDTPPSGTRKVAKPSEKPRTNKPANVVKATPRPTIKNTERPSSGGGSKVKAKAVIASALAKYKSEDFAGAQSLLRSVQDMRASRRDKSKAKRLGSQIASFADSYNRGMKIAANNPSGIKVLEKALSLDKRLGRAFAGRIKRQLAKFYAFKAVAFFQAQRYGMAGRFAKKALGRDPNQKQARKIYDQISVKAQELLDRAKQSRSNPDKAVGLLHKALAIFQPGTPGYGEANSLLSELEDDEDEDEDE